MNIETGKSNQIIYQIGPESSDIQDEVKNFVKLIPLLAKKEAKVN